LPHRRGRALKAAGALCAIRIGLLLPNSPPSPAALSTTRQKILPPKKKGGGADICRVTADSEVNSLVRKLVRSHGEYTELIRRLHTASTDFSLLPETETVIISPRSDDAQPSPARDFFSGEPLETKESNRVPLEGCGKAPPGTRAFAPE